MRKIKKVIYRISLNSMRREAERRMDYEIFDRHLSGQLDAIQILLDGLNEREERPNE
jgi:hypothetical protein